MTAASAITPLQTSTRPRRRSGRPAAIAIAVTAVLAASPAVAAAKSPDRPHPVRPAAGARPHEPMTVVELARTSREPRAAGAGSL